jgi:hypothetical protein
MFPDATERLPHDVS